MITFDPGAVETIVADHVDRIMAERGLTPMGISSSVTPARHLRRFSLKAQQDVHIWATVMLRYDRHASEGDRERRTRVDNALDDDLQPTAALTARLCEIVEGHARLDRRDDAIRQAGGDVLRPPPWAFHHDEMIPALLDMLGTTMENLFEGARYSADSNGWNLAAVKPGRLSSAVRLTGDRLHVDRFRCSETEKVFMNAEEKRRVVLYVHGMDIPDTVVNGMKGMGIGEVIGHPSLRRMGTRSIIRKAQRLAGGEAVMIELEGMRQWPRAPDGIDLGWRVA